MQYVGGLDLPQAMLIIREQAGLLPGTTDALLATSGACPAGVAVLYYLSRVRAAAQPTQPASSLATRRGMP